MTDLDKLEALAKAAGGKEWRLGGGGFVAEGDAPIADFLAMPDPDDWKSGPSIGDAVDRAKFVAAANPATILALIASARRDAEEIERLKRELAAADGRTADYRTVAINQGWNWNTCDAYGRKEYAKHRGEHVDACALNAAEARARAAHTGEG